jgi:peptidyl-prolyl cis-trans isomerase D
MSGRIVEYKPAVPRPFADVQEEIRRQLMRRAASEMAQKAGGEKLAALQAGNAAAGVTFGKPVTVNEAGGYSIYKIVKVIDPPPPDAAKVAAAGTRVGEQLGRELFTAYLASLKAGTDVKINPGALEKK